MDFCHVFAVSGKGIRNVAEPGLCFVPLLVGAFDDLSLAPLSLMERTGKGSLSALLWRNYDALPCL